MLKDDVKLEIINKLTLHIEKLEMDNEIHILRDDLDETNYITGREYILKLKETLGKLIQEKSLSNEEISSLKEIIKDKDLIKQL